MNKYIISTIAIVATVLATVSCQRDDKYSDKNGLSISINASESLDIRDITLWIYNNDGEMVGSERTYSSLAEVASDLIDIPAGEYSVAAALNTSDYFTTEENGDLKMISVDTYYFGTPAGESQTMIGSGRVVVEDGLYSICTVDIETPYITMSCEINNLPDIVTEALFSVSNVANAVNPYTGEYLYYNPAAAGYDPTSVAHYGSSTPIDGVINFSARNYMPAIEGESLMFYVKLFYSDGHYDDIAFYCSPVVAFNICPILPEQGKSYLFSLDYNDMSAGYINLGNNDSDNETVVVDQWIDSEDNIEGEFN